MAITRYGRLTATALVATALSARVAVGTRLTAIVVAVPLNAVILPDLTDAVAFTGALHTHPPSSLCQLPVPP